MAKTTKIVRGIHSWIKFQRHQGIQSLTIEGKDSLADIDMDSKGDTNLTLNADKDKLNEITSSVPYLVVSDSLAGKDPNQIKTATISQDLTQFPIVDGELVTVLKSMESLAIQDGGIKTYVTGLLAPLSEKLDNTLKPFKGVALVNQGLEEDLFPIRILKAKNPLEYHVLAENISEGSAFTLNLRDNDITGHPLSETILENFKDGSTILSVVGAEVTVGYLNEDNFIRFTFKKVTSPSVKIHLKMTGKPTPSPKPAIELEGNVPQPLAGDGAGSEHTEV